MRILLVEDHPLVGDGLQAGLKHCGFTVDWVRDGIAARHALASEEDYSAVVLDLGLPRLSGLDLLQEIRGGANAVPVLILTARDTTQDKISGLNAGADDYMTKPVDLDELAARLHALIRRSGGRAEPNMKIGDVELDPVGKRAWRAGAQLELSARELTILATLMGNAGRMVSRPQLESTIYGFSDGVESNAVEVHIHHLRKKLGADFIKTVRGLGYIIEKTS